MLELQSEARKVFGKALKKSRDEGKIPAVVYGKGQESISLFVPANSFAKVWKEAGESTIITIKGEASKTPLNVIIQQVDIDPTSSRPVHVDFLKVDMDKTIQVGVPLVFEGVAAAVKELGGVLVKVMHEIEVEALPKDLPHEIKVDISKLKTFEDHITIGDINLPQGVKAIEKPEEIVALAEQPKEEVEEPVRTIEDIEVEKKGKKEEEATTEGK
jgi:large subunit ribosomal protein L25